jgi:pimeloyl-ACP methyl ester carboxylesterase
MQETRGGMGAMAMTNETVRSSDGTVVGFQSFGAGDGVIVVGGSLSAARDYVPFAEVLARSFTVHVMDRRGRGRSGPQGPEYGIEKECEDVLAIQSKTGARAAFGHSYGGLICLETARRSTVFNRLAVYEPGVSVGGCVSGAWLPRFRELLRTGDTRGAFAWMVKGAGFAPAWIARLPLWCLRVVLRAAIPRRRWREMEPLLVAHAQEHEQVVRLDGALDRYSSLPSRVLLLGGARSPPAITGRSLDALHAVISDSTLEIIDGLGHAAPNEQAPQVVGERVRRWLRQGPEGAARDDGSRGWRSLAKA